MDTYAFNINIQSTVYMLILGKTTTACPSDNDSLNFKVKWRVYTIHHLDYANFFFFWWERQKLYLKMRRGKHSILRNK